MGERNIQFKCPNCKYTTVEEIMVDVGVSSEIHGLRLWSDGGVDVQYGEQTNEDGHIDRYICANCGYTIADHTSRHANDGLDECALVKAIEELNAIAEEKEPELISVDELANRFSKLIREGLSGEDLATFWNNLVDEKIVYEGDSMFRVKK